jgi:hypothetical protein
MRKLRLIVTDKCERDCSGCCNKLYDLTSLPVCDDYRGFDEVIITGGEPLLVLSRVYDVIEKVRNQSPESFVILYTALRRDNNSAVDAYKVSVFLDGMTVTLHYPEDVPQVRRLAEMISHMKGHGNLRLNVFDDISVEGIPLNKWNVRHTHWHKNKSLPDGEVLMRHKDALKK